MGSGTELVILRGSPKGLAPQDDVSEKKRPVRAPFDLSLKWRGLLRRRIGSSGAGLGGLQPLARFVGAFLQLFLQLLLVLLENLRVGRRTVIGLGETVGTFLQGQWKRQRVVVGRDRLNVQRLPLLHVGKQFRRQFVVRDA